MIAAHLPVLPVLAPLAAAPLCVLWRRADAAWLSFLLAALAILGCAIALAVQLPAGGALRYALGGWDAPVGIEYVVDGANLPLLLLIGALAVVTALYARRAVAQEIEPARIYLFYACLCLHLAGLLGICLTGDAFNVFVFLEISSLSAYALIAMGRARRALLASFRYLVMGTVGGTFLLIGIGLLYALTGTLNMADLLVRLPPLHGSRTLDAALGFIAVGLAIKAAVFPLHAWQPDAYAEAPPTASLLLAGAGAKVALYAFLRYGWGVFGGEFVAARLSELLLLLGVLAMLVGAGTACLQTDLRRVLAWSSVSQIGYIVAAIGLATPAGLAAAYLHLVGHGLIKAGLFAVAGVLLLRLGTTRLEALGGLAGRMPWTFAALLAGGLGLIGVPLTAGFVSKWALAQALIDARLWWVLAAMLASSLLALVYVGRIVEIAWFRPPPGDAAAAPLALALPTALLVLASLWIGVQAAPLARLATRAAATLGGGG